LPNASVSVSDEPALKKREFFSDEPPRVANAHSVIQMSLLTRPVLLCTSASFLLFFKRLKCTIMGPPKTRFEQGGELWWLPGPTLPTPYQGHQQQQLQLQSRAHGHAQPSAC